MKVSVQTIFEKLFDDEAREVVLPGEDGEFSVWDFHQPCLYSLERGLLRIIPRKSQEFRLEIKRGIANIKPDSVVLIVEI